VTKFCPRLGVDRCGDENLESGIIHIVRMRR
jgi:hypothetical protein